MASALTLAPKDVSMEISRTPSPRSQAYPRQDETVSASRDYSLGGLQVQGLPHHQVAPEPTIRRFPVAPGYHLPSFLEDGDASEDDDKLGLDPAPPLGYKSCIRQVV